MNSRHIPTLAAILALAACAQGHSPRGDAPSVGSISVAANTITQPGEPGTPFAISGSAEAVAAKLRAAGLDVTLVSPGLVSGSSRSNALVDCGTIVVREGEEERRFAGNAPTAVIPRSGSAGSGFADFVRRDVAVDTKFSVALAGGQARVTENHLVVVTDNDILTEAVLSSREVRFPGSELGRLSSDLVCASSGAIRQAVQS